MVEEVVLGGEVSPVTEARWLLREALAVATGASRRVEFRRGSVPQALGKLAAGVDLLVVGSDRSGPAGCVSLGEKASAVVDGAPCPCHDRPTANRCRRVMVRLVNHANQVTTIHPARQEPSPR